MLEQRVTVAVGELSFLNRCAKLFFCSCAYPGVGYEVGCSANISLASSLCYNRHLLSLLDNGG